MNLIFIAALVAVCGAAKLDRTYLPPATAKTAGGAAGSLQAPFPGNSFNDNSGLPKGSFTNDFQGVVVDAAAAGTRASGEGETGLGAPRISYGSTDSRVGDAAFRGTAAGFRPFPGQNFNRQGGQAGQAFNRQSAQAEQNYEEQGSQSFAGQNGQNFDGQREQNFGGQNGQNFGGQRGQNFGGQNGQNFGGQNGQNYGGQNAQSFEGQNGQNFEQTGSETADGQTASSQVQSSAQGLQNRGQAQFNQANRGPSRFSKPERSQAPFDRAANTLRFENEVGLESYHYAFETDNGISAEENGVATNGVQAQGGFSYTGDDGQVYTVTYTADEGGYQPRGDHLPTPPPIPEEILKSLAKNAQDEAAGLIDDGSYDAQKYNAGADYTESDGANVQYNDRQTPSFGKRPEADATASGTFINQNNQPFVGQPGQDDGSSDSQDVPSDAFGPASNANRFGQAAQPSRTSTNAIGSSGTANAFGQTPQSGRVPSSNDGFGATNNFGQGSKPSRFPSSNGFGSRKEYLPPVNGFSQNGRPQRPVAAAQPNLGFNQASQTTQDNAESQDSQESQSLVSSGRPTNKVEAPAQGPQAENQQANNAFDSTPDANNFAQAEQSSQNSAPTFGTRNEYLPPRFGQNGKPQRLRPQRPTQSADATAAPSFNAPSQAFGTFQPTQGSKPAPVSNVQTSQQLNGFQQSSQSFNNQFSQNGFAAAQEEQNEGSGDEAQNGQSSDGFIALNQRPTSQPSAELTTPFESNEQSQSTPADLSDAESGFGSDSPSKRPGFEKLANSQSASRPIRPQNQATGSQQQTSFSVQEQNQFVQPSYNGNQAAVQTSFDQDESKDTQFSPSSERPSFSQGPDQSYYYRQPARPFNTPSGSKFPGAPSSQFNRVTQQTQFSGNTQQNFPVNRGSTRFPVAPTLAPTAPTGSNDGQFQASTASAQYNGITQASISPFQSQGSTRFPRPTLSSAAPTSSAQFNGITQATASSFPSAPSASFGSRPTFQQSSFNQPQSAAQPNKPFAQPESEGEASQGLHQETPVSSQQYSGEIYEYSKPPQGLPSTAQKEPTSAPQRGPMRPQFASAQGANGQELNMQQQPTRPTFGQRPQFGSQPSRQQFGSYQGSGSQDQPAQESKPQFAQSRPFAQSQGQSASPAGTRPKCCQSLDSKLQSFRGTAQNNVAASAQNQFGNAAISQSAGQDFGSQFSGPTSQPGSQTFAGQGEAFGGPRKPPSFDQETGYHY